MGAVWFVDPFFIHQIHFGRPISVAESGPTTPDAVGDAPPYPAADGGAVLNRVFNERNHEVYSAFLDGRTIISHMADTSSSSTEPLGFSTANCPGTSDRERRSTPFVCV